MMARSLLCMVIIQGTLMDHSLVLYVRKKDE